MQNYPRKSGVFYCSVFRIFKGGKTSLVLDSDIFMRYNSNIEKYVCSFTLKSKKSLKRDENSTAQR